MTLLAYLSSLSSDPVEKLKICVVGPVLSWNTPLMSITSNVKAIPEILSQIDVHVQNYQSFEPLMAKLTDTSKENGSNIPDNLIPSTNIAQSASEADILIFVTPLEQIEEICECLSNSVKKSALSLSLTPGVLKIDGQIALVSEKVQDKLGIPCYSYTGTDSEAVLGCPNAGHAELLGKLLYKSGLKLNVTKDVGAVEICGALKQILDITHGICKGLHLNEAEKSRIMLQGINEMFSFYKEFTRAQNVPYIFDNCGMQKLFAFPSTKAMHAAQVMIESNKALPQIENELLSGCKLLGSTSAENVAYLIKHYDMEREFPLFTMIHKICSNVMKAKDITRIELPQEKVTELESQIDIKKILEGNTSTRKLLQNTQETFNQNSQYAYVVRNSSMECQKFDNNCTTSIKASVEKKPESIKTNENVSGTILDSVPKRKMSSVSKTTDNCENNEILDKRVDGTGQQNGIVQNNRCMSEDLNDLNKGILPVSSKSESPLPNDCKEENLQPKSNYFVGENNSQELSSKEIVTLLKKANFKVIDDVLTLKTAMNEAYLKPIGKDEMRESVAECKEENSKVLNPTSQMDEILKQAGSNGRLISSNKAEQAPEAVTSSDFDKDLLFKALNVRKISETVSLVNTSTSRAGNTNQTFNSISTKMIPLEHLCNVASKNPSLPFSKSFKNSASANSSDGPSGDEPITENKDNKIISKLDSSSMKNVESPSEFSQIEAKDKNRVEKDGPQKFPIKISKEEAPEVFISPDVAKLRNTSDKWEPYDKLQNRSAEEKENSAEATKKIIQSVIKDISEKPKETLLKGLNENEYSAKLKASSSNEGPEMSKTQKDKPLEIITSSPRVQKLIIPGQTPGTEKNIIKGEPNNFAEIPSQVLKQKNTPRPKNRIQKNLENLMRAIERKSSNNSASLTTRIEAIKEKAQMPLFKKVKEEGAFLENISNKSEKTDSQISEINAIKESSDKGKTHQEILEQKPVYLNSALVHAEHLQLQDGKKSDQLKDLEKHQPKEKNIKKSLENKDFAPEIFADIQKNSNEGTFENYPQEIQPEKSNIFDKQNLIQASDKTTEGSSEGTTPQPMEAFLSSKSDKEAFKKLKLLEKIAKITKVDSEQGLDNTTDLSKKDLPKDIAAKKTSESDLELEHKRKVIEKLVQKHEILNRQLEKKQQALKKLEEMEKQKVFTFEKSQGGQADEVEKKVVVAEDKKMPALGKSQDKEADGSKKKAIVAESKQTITSDKSQDKKPEQEKKKAIVSESKASVEKKEKQKIVASIVEKKPSETKSQSKDETIAKLKDKEELKGDSFKRKLSAYFEKARQTNVSEHEDEKELKAKTATEAENKKPIESKEIQVQELIQKYDLTGGKKTVDAIQKEITKPKENDGKIMSKTTATNNEKVTETKKIVSGIQNDKKITSSLSATTDRAPTKKLKLKDCCQPKPNINITNNKYMHTDSLNSQENWNNQMKKGGQGIIQCKKNALSSRVLSPFIRSADLNKRHSPGMTHIVSKAAIFALKYFRK